MPPNGLAASQGHSQVVPVASSAACKLDEYISKVLSGDKNTDDFVYLVKNPDNDDLYDLVLKTYFETQGKRQLKLTKKAGRPGAQSQAEMGVAHDYYTISKKGLCHFRQGKPVEFIGLNKWLEEREIFHKIKRLEFFSSFRQWKTIKLWRDSYRNFKKRVARKKLEENLLFAVPELKSCLIRTKEDLYNMSLSSLFDLAAAKDNSAEVNSFEQFLSIQEQRARKTQSIIQGYSAKINAKVNDAIQAKISDIQALINVDEGGQPSAKPTPNTSLKASENPYHNLDFNENLSYDKRSLIRKECSRFVRFFHLVDILAVDTLIKIYVNSFKSLISEVEELCQIRDPLVYRDAEKSKPVTRKDPMFQLRLNFNCAVAQPLEGFRVVEKEVGEFRFPKMEDEDTKPADYRDYNIITYPFLLPEVPAEEFNEQQRNYLEFREARAYTHRVLANIQEVVTQLEPGVELFLERIDKLFNEALTYLQAFNSFAKHPNMKKYVAILEEWEEREDEREEALESAIINPQEYIDTEEKNLLEKQLKTLVRDEFRRASRFLEEYREVLQLNWEYKRFDFGLLLSRRLGRPAQTFVAILNLLEFHKSHFETHVPYQADVGLFRIDSTELKAAMIRGVRDFEATLVKLLPKEIQSRLAECREWFEGSFTRLKQNANDIEGFVEASRNLRDVERNLAYYRDLLKTTKEIQDSLRKFQLGLQNETSNAADQDVKSKENGLLAQITQVNDTLAKNQELFSKDITLKNIPQLERRCRALEDTLNEPRFYEEDGQNRLPELHRLEDETRLLREEAQRLNQFEEVLGLKKTRFESLQSLLENFGAKKLLWESHYEWGTRVEGLRASPFDSIEVKEIQEVVDRFQKNVSRCRKVIPLTNPILAGLDKSIKDFASLLPVVLALRNNNLKDTHIAEIEGMIKIKLNNPNLKFQDLITQEVLEQQKQIIGVSVQVEQELMLKG